MRENRYSSRIIAIPRYNSIGNAGDKGFPPSKIKNELQDRPNLHFLTPIKRNDVRIAGNDMLSFEGILEGVDAHVVYNPEVSIFT